MSIIISTELTLQPRTYIVAVYKILFNNGYFYIGATRNLHQRYTIHKINFKALSKFDNLSACVYNTGATSGVLEIIQLFDNDSYIPYCFETEKQVIRSNKDNLFMINKILYDEDDKRLNKVISIINKYEISYNLLANKIGIKAPQFSEKIRNKRGNKFTPEQQNNLITHLKKMAEDISLLEK